MAKVRGACSICGNPSKKPGSRYCSTHDKAVYEGIRPWILHKKNHCEMCGFIPVNHIQLDVDHIDGNKSNNDPKNLQTLCANCHRLKTWINKDWEQRHEQIEDEVEQLGLF